MYDSNPLPAPGALHGSLVKIFLEFYWDPVDLVIIMWYITCKLTGVYRE